MSLKHYLRGLGIGILITAVILAITGKTEKMTDAEIKIRAAQLGMVEEKVLSDLASGTEASEESNNPMDGSEALSETEQESSEVVNESIEEDTEEEGASSVPESEEESSKATLSEAGSEEAAVSDEAESSAEEVAEASKPEPTVTTVVSSNSGTNNREAEGIVTQEDEYIIFTIESGEPSSSITQKLYAAGLIDSTEEYDNYLISQGYSRKLRSGTHRIPVGASDEQIAKILCRMN
ncbi:MAG: hypothetical protein IJP31_01980 [Lachnospiraceae bacterium]|nr:hypothetical protein [Lachnospiraceae bacterium]